MPGRTTWRLRGPNRQCAAVSTVARPDQHAGAAPAQLELHPARGRARARRGGRRGGAGPPCRCPGAARARGATRASWAAAGPAASAARSSARSARRRRRVTRRAFRHRAAARSTNAGTSRVAGPCRASSNSALPSEGSRFSSTVRAPAAHFGDEAGGRIDAARGADRDEQAAALGAPPRSAPCPSASRRTTPHADACRRASRSPGRAGRWRGAAGSAPPPRS